MRFAGDSFTESQPAAMACAAVNPPGTKIRTHGAASSPGSFLKSLVCTACSPPVTEWRTDLNPRWKLHVSVSHQTINNTCRCRCTVLPHQKLTGWPPNRYGVSVWRSFTLMRGYFSGHQGSVLLSLSGAGAGAARGAPESGGAPPPPPG